MYKILVTRNIPGNYIEKIENMEIEVFSGKGKAIARRASGFNMKIIYYSRHRHDVDADFTSID